MTCDECGADSFDDDVCDNCGAMLWGWLPGDGDAGDEEDYEWVTL